MFEKLLSFLKANLFSRWYDTLFPRIPVPTQKEIMEKLHAHGPYKGGNHGAHSRYVRWQVSKDALISLIAVNSPFFVFLSFRYGYNEYEEEEQYPSKSSNAIEMPETFGNASSSAAASSSSDSYRDRKYRSSRDDRSRSRSPDRRRHHQRHHRNDSPDRYGSHRHHHRRSSSREDRRRHHQRSRSRSPDNRYRNNRHDRS